MGGCQCPHHKIIPLCITLIGLAFLLGAFDVVNARFVAVAWPLLLTIAGVTKLAKGMCKCCGAGMGKK